MFEDLIVEKDIDEHGPVPEPEYSQEDKFMYDLLCDVEEVIDEFQAQAGASRQPCIWCGAKQGQKHDNGCFYLTTIKRLIAEINTYGNKTPV